jgi:anthranilate synthase/aminodeoxychorismate synthase-like glutamine amidotransferase
VTARARPEQGREPRRRIVVIDNYDSFTYNLVQYLGELGARVDVCCNAAPLDAIERLEPDGILLSPGPGSPDEAGITLDAIRHFSGRVPLLGVCLGHQAIAQCFGARVVRAPRLMHGRTSPIEHGGGGLFRGLPSPFRATRYHSLIVAGDTLGPWLERTAWTEEGEVMAIRHRRLAVEGVQFHPESFLSEHGHTLLSNFLDALPGRREEAMP